MVRYEVDFSVPFLQGWQRAGANHKTRKHFTQAETRDAEDQIAIAYKGASLRKYGRVVKAPKGVPVHVKMDFYKKEPKSWPDYLPRWMRPLIPFVVKIDVDNGVKCGLDALNEVAWQDDAQVVTVFASKKDRNGVKRDHTDFTVVWEVAEDVIPTEGD